jgi:transcriptional regulator GlxA family with amidase domain
MTAIPTYLLAADELTLLDMAGPADVLRLANRHAGREVFALHFCGATPEVRTSAGLHLSRLEPLPERLPDAALVLVLGLATKATFAMTATHPIAAWLRKSFDPKPPASHRLATVCAGAVIAAHAGLLAGLRCTTHHDVLGALAAAEPSAQVLQNRLFVEDGAVLTCAGVTAGIDLCLMLVERHTTPQIALATAQDLVVFMRRSGGDPQLSPLLQFRNHVHAAVHKAQNAVLAEPARAWSAASLAAIACVTPRHLTRLFRAEAGTTPLDYVRHIRVALARQLSAEGAHSKERVAELAGFSSAQQLRRASHKTL